LTAAGLAEARTLAARLTVELDPTSVVVLASRSARAIETAEVVAAALGRPVSERTCDLCEVHPGAVEGLTPDEMERRYGPSYQFVPGGDRWPDWLPRALASLERIAAVYRGRSIVALTHSGVVRASFVAFGGMPPGLASRVRSANTGITEWSTLPDEGTAGAGAWRLDRHNDVAHLRA
jgi:broad specificity phosphatase PhoE